ncbi:hypothetical protein MBLNU230_g3259t1 [Neophaeotheca triangularis]
MATQQPAPGIQVFTHPKYPWRITTAKHAILKAGPIEALSEDIQIPIPEMIFGDNHVAIEHVPTGWKLGFNARDALDRVSKTEEGMLQVAVAGEWKKTRESTIEADDVRRVVRPFDWSYSTDYRGSTSGAESGSWRPTTSGGDDEAPPVIRTDLLRRPDPILFFDSVDLYEDELADNGIALLAVKIRVMPERLLVLSRFFLRLDGVVVRLRETRVYVEFALGRVVRQYTAKEGEYAGLADELRRGRENVAEAFRDPDALAPLLGLVEERNEVVELG